MNTTAPTAAPAAVVSAALAPTPAVAEATAAPTAVRTATPEHCTNCGAPVPGRYCGACGQRREPPVHSLWHFTHVAAEDLTHADSRLWRTLAALLFRPGYLTREFLAGRRVRYLPPLRLYLVLSVAFFIWAGLDSRKVEVINIDDQHHLSVSEMAPKAREVYTPFSPLAPGETEAQRTQRLCGNRDYQGPWQQFLKPRLPLLCQRIVADRGRSLSEAFMHNVPRALFVFLPLLAGLMMLMYWRPRHYYVEHLLLCVHNHAFVFLVLMLSWVLYAPLPSLAPWVTVALWLYIPWYLFRSMRRVYGQTRALTFGKFVLLSFFYLVSGALMLAATSVYSVLTL